MTEEQIREILQQVAAGRLDVPAALTRLRYLPFEDLGFAKLDLHRSLRRGVPEVVLGEHKSAAQIAAIGARVVKAGQNLIVTRLSPDKARAVKRTLRAFDYQPEAQLGCIIKKKAEPSGHGPVMVISAGTSDIAVAEEAALCAELFGNRVTRLYDVGVAGLHRLRAGLDALAEAAVLIVVAGMEGALPSVVAGLLFPGAKANFATWAGIDQCTGSPQPQSAEAACETYSTCGAGAEVTLCTVPNGTHCGNYGTFPIVGTAWSMFQSHPLP